MSFIIRTSDIPDEASRGAIVRGLVAYNDSKEESLRFVIRARGWERKGFQPSAAGWRLEACSPARHGAHYAAMETQSYANHRHNPKLTGIGFMFLVLAIVAFGLRWFNIGGRYSMAAGLLALMASVQVLLSISRLYITKLQDRIIKLEMKLRCATLLSPEQQVAYSKLGKAQTLALRFASDQELPGLLERTARENLNADQIKRAIRDWVPDWDRT